MRGLLYALSVILLAACTGQGSGHRDIPSRPQEIVPLHRLFYDMRDNPAERWAADFEDHRADYTTFLPLICDVPVPVTDTLMMGWANSMPVGMFTPPVDSVFPDLRPMEETLGAILAAADTFGLDLPHRRYATVVWGKSQSIGFADSMMFIALNHYLGSGHDVYKRWPAYVRASKDSKFLPYDIAEAMIATRYPFCDTIAPEDNTLLAHLLYNGALVYAKMQVVPTADLAAALGYDKVRTEWLLEHEAEMWSALVGRNLLYDTDPRTSDRMLAPGPSTRDLHQLAPGRAGRFIGYRIVDAYMRSHPGTAIHYLLSPEFYANPASLSRADYTP